MGLSIQYVLGKVRIHGKTPPDDRKQRLVRTLGQCCVMLLCMMGTCSSLSQWHVTKLNPT